MKTIKTIFLLLTFLFLLVGCGKKGIYDYSENDKYKLLIAAKIDGDEKAKKELEEVIKGLDYDYRRNDTKAKAHKQLRLWTLQEDIVKTLWIDDVLGEFEKALKKGKAQEFIENHIKMMQEKYNKK